MSSERTMRKRHQVGKGTIEVLRIFGWRYSATRDAWVHRLGKGRVGPVFQERGDRPDRGIPYPDEAFNRAIVAAPTQDPDHRPPPRRAIARP